MCLSAGALTMIVIGLIKNRRTANFAVTFIVLPQMFLSGAIIPINNNSGVLLVLSRILPMTYCLDLMRAVVYAGTQDYANVVLFNPVICAICIVALTAIFLAVGTFFFAKSETNR
jgi:ABC-2 type transport system permease protein